MPPPCPTSALHGPPRSRRSRVRDFGLVPDRDFELDLMVRLVGAANQEDPVALSLDTP